MAEDHIPTAAEYALFREAYAETYPVSPLLNAIDALEEENARLRAALLEPDSDLGVEKWETLCPLHMTAVDIVNNALLKIGAIGAAPNG